MTAKRPQCVGLALTIAQGLFFGEMHHLFSLLAARTDRSASQRGQSLVEYALILVLIAVVVVIILITQGQTMIHMYSNIACGMKIGCS